MNSKLARVSTATAAIQGSEQNAGDSVVAKWSQLHEQPLCTISEDYQKTIIFEFPSICHYFSESGFGSCESVILLE